MDSRFRWLPIALVPLALGACGGDGGGNDDGVDAATGQPDAAAAADADPNAPDADPNIPDANPNAPDAAACSNPGTATCSIDGNSLEVCSAGGLLDVEACAYGCGADPQNGSDRCNLCTPSATECQGDALVTCDADGEIQTQVDCLLGCDGAAAPSACFVLEPSNLPDTVCDSTGGIDIVIDTNSQFNTDDGPCSQVIQQGGGGAPDICVRRVGSLTVAAGVTYKVRGSRALAIVASHSIDILGTIDVSADGRLSGPGRVFFGDGDNGNTDVDGGGGAGFATVGGNGETGAAPNAQGGAGGLMFGDATLSPLVGGSRGGRNDNGDNARGGAGGALQLVSCGTLTVSGTIDASGGGGPGGPGVDIDLPPQGGSGGGSGGGLLLEGAIVDITGSLAANGGGGGGGGLIGNEQGPGLGGQDGADGEPGVTQAGGGNGPFEAGSGGAGAAGGAGPANGEAPVVSTGGAGGGGGAVGRIRINVRPGTSPTVSGVVSPAQSAGEVSVH